MGTAIIYEGGVYVFDDMGPEKAVESFLKDWVRDATSFEVRPIRGRQSRSIGAPGAGLLDRFCK